MQMERYREMHRQVLNINKSAKFYDLLKFLRAERNATEYAISNLRKGVKSASSSVCTIKTSCENSYAIHFWTDNNSTAECRTLKNLSIKDKFNVLKEKSVCVASLNPGHSLEDCKLKVKSEVDTCVEFHHPSLNMVTKDVSVTTVKENSLNSPDYVLLPIMKVTPDW